MTNTSLSTSNTLHSEYTILDQSTFNPRLIMSTDPLDNFLAFPPHPDPLPGGLERAFQLATSAWASKAKTNSMNANGKMGSMHSWDPKAVFALFTSVREKLKADTAWCERLSTPAATNSVQAQLEAHLTTVQDLSSAGLARSFEAEVKPLGLSHEALGDWDRYADINQDLLDIATSARTIRLSTLCLDHRLASKPQVSVTALRQSRIVAAGKLVKAVISLKTQTLNDSSRRSCKVLHDWISVIAASADKSHQLIGRRQSTGKMSKSSPCQSAPYATEIDPVLSNLSEGWENMHASWGGAGSVPLDDVYAQLSKSAWKLHDLTVLNKDIYLTGWSFLKDHFLGSRIYESPAAIR